MIHSSLLILGIVLGGLAFKGETFGAIKLKNACAREYLDQISQSRDQRMDLYHTEKKVLKPSGWLSEVDLRSKYMQIFSQLKKQTNGKVLRKPSKMGGMILEYVLEDGSLAGKLVYDVKGKRLDVLSVESHVKKKGVATLLVSRALIENPKTEQIMGFLTDTNLMEFKKHIHKKGPIEAIKETPAFKIRRSLGFGEVDSNSELGDHELILITNREDLIKE